MKWIVDIKGEIDGDYELICKYEDGKERWIPVSETVDIPEHEVLACDKYGTELIGFLYEKDEQWMCESDECIMYDVVAWQSSPEPYRGE